MADKSKIGKVFPEMHWEVERGKIRELVKAIGDDNPVYLDADEAKKQGYKDVPAPPTFLTVPVMWSGSMLDAITDLDINFAMVLHGEEEYEYYAEIYPGDCLSGSPKVANIEEKTSKSGRKMDIVTIEIAYTNQRDERVARQKMVIVERK
ncbi:MAG: MaoC family dehydratase N-terminal domain-containing protein [Thermodesulfobacteriota bacterium]|nr:MaoC family dehydratase N-terminal domain-containing protein [Thermodesulfobacteriota bacterium]